MTERDLHKPTGEPDDLETCMSGSGEGCCESTELLRGILSHNPRAVVSAYSSRARVGAVAQLVARRAPCHGVNELHSESAGGSDLFSPESI